jgi:hypothetical protein
VKLNIILVVATTWKFNQKLKDKKYWFVRV